MPIPLPDTPIPPMYRDRTPYPVQIEYPTFDDVIDNLNR